MTCDKELEDCISNNCKAMDEFLKNHDIEPVEYNDYNDYHNAHLEVFAERERLLIEAGSKVVIAEKLFYEREIEEHIKYRKEMENMMNYKEALKWLKGDETRVVRSPSGEQYWYSCRTKNLQYAFDSHLVPNTNQVVMNMQDIILDQWVKLDTPQDGISFDEALEHLKDGKTVKRYNCTDTYKVKSVKTQRFTLDDLEATDWFVVV